MTTIANVTRLPTASRTYIDIRGKGARWSVDLVTPIPGQKPLRTTLKAVAGPRDVAERVATETAALMERPFGKPAA